MPPAPPPWHRLSAQRRDTHTPKGLLLSPGATGDADNLYDHSTRDLRDSAALLPEVTATVPESSGGVENSLDIEDAVHMALSWHPSIAVAASRIREQDEEIRIARAGYYPQIKSGIDAGYRHDGRGAWRPQINVTASQMLYDFGKVSSSVEAETAASRAARAQLLLSIDELARETANAAIEVQRSQLMKSIAEDQVAGIKAIARLASERTEKDVSTQSDQLQAEARVQAAESELLQINAQHQLWSARLSNLIGQTPGRVSPSPPEWLVKTCEITEPKWTRVPALMKSEAQQSEALARLEQSAAELMPTLLLEGSAGYDLHDNSGSDHERGWDGPEFMVGLRVSMDLYEGGRNQARRRAASHALSTAEATARQTRLEITTNLAEAQAQVSSLLDLLASLHVRDSMMQQTRDIYNQQYVQLGTRTLLDLLNAEQELHQARFAHANTIHDLRRLNVECMFNAGTTRSLLKIDQEHPERHELEK